MRQRGMTVGEELLAIPLFKEPKLVCLNAFIKFSTFMYSTPLQLLLEAELNLASYATNQRSPYLKTRLDLSVLVPSLEEKICAFFDSNRATSNRYSSIRDFLRALPSNLSRGTHCRI